MSSRWPGAGVALTDDATAPVVERDGPTQRDLRRFGGRAAGSYTLDYISPDATASHQEAIVTTNENVGVGWGIPGDGEQR